MTATNLTTPTSSVAAGGRAASIARRRALSAGKSALPPAAERVRSGERSAALPAAAAARTHAATPAATNILHLPSPATSAGAAPHAATVSAHAPASTNPVGLSGRLLSMERRRLLAAGKQALRAGMQAAPPARSAAPSASPAEPAKGAECEHDSCRQLARARRAMQSAQGRGCTPAAPPSRPGRAGRLQYAPKVVESITQARQSVTGLRIGTGSQVTGVTAGATLPVSGTQYIGSEGGTAVRSVPPKVGFARTVRGGVVSGTLVRSGVPITGDEAGSGVTITGEAEQKAEDDLTERGGDRAYVAAQFQRQADPHGHSVFGSNLGRTASHIGSRERRREAPLESTDAGLAITGSAVGRTARVTGDEDGACRLVTGDQYVSPARAQAECGGAGGGTAPTTQPTRHPMGVRRDPVTGGKVSTAATWGGQRITGTDVEHNPRVTGDAPGSCSLITGTPYQGPQTMQGWCDPEAAQAAEQRLPRQPATSAVTGDTPMHADRVTGTARGVARSITGTPYYRDSGAVPPTEDPVGALDERFSVHSPQRAAHLKAERAAVDTPEAASRITGSFAVGGQKITGNLEFAFKPRHAPDAEAKPAHTRVTGEGRTAGSRISGDPWAARKNVTGTEGFTAIARNASERNGKPQTAAAAGRFKAPGVKIEKGPDKQLVTGMFGWSSKDSAKVTLSGGALG
jgi:hypothetical protein